LKSIKLDRKIFFVELKHIFGHSWPLIIGQVSQASIGLTDTIMVGWFGIKDLSAVAIGNSVWIPMFLGSSGVLMVIAPNISKLRVKKHFDFIRDIFISAIWISLGLFVISFLAIKEFSFLFYWIGIDREIIPITERYLNAISYGIFPAYLQLIFRYYDEGFGKTKTIMWIAIIGVPLNIIGNYVLIYGNWGFPALGAEGAGFSTAIILWLCTILYFYLFIKGKALENFKNISSHIKPSFQEIGRQLRIGLPAGFINILNIGLFSVLAMVTGTFGIVETASHQILFNYITVIYMVPWAISMGIAVRVGFHRGGDNPHLAVISGKIGIGITTVIMAFIALATILFPEKIAGIYSQNDEVIKLVSTLLFTVGFFLLADSIFLSSLGALRGFGDTKGPMKIVFITHWLIALPLCLLFGIFLDLKVQGIWFGLLIGFCIVAYVLNKRFWLFNQNKNLVFQQ